MITISSIVTSTRNWYGHHTKPAQSSAFSRT